MSGLSSSVAYTLKKNSVPSRLVRSSIQPTNKSTFSGLNTVVFHIPAGKKGSYLDGNMSYLQFKITNNDGAQALVLDRSAFALIQRLDVFHGSNLLESIQNFNVLATALTDYQYSADMKATNWTLGFASTTTGKSISASASMYITIPLISGVVGHLLDKYLPIGSLNDDIRIELTLADTDAIGTSASAHLDWTLSDVWLQTQIVEVSPEGETIINEIAGGMGRVIHGTSFRTFQNTLFSGSASQTTHLVPARFASLKSLYCIPRDDVSASASKYNVGSRPAVFDKFQLKIGSEVYPSKQITNPSEAYSEVLKTFHGLYNTQTGTSVAQSNYECGTTNSVGNMCLYGVNTDSFSGKSDVLNSGMNTLSVQTFWESEKVSTVSNVQLDFCALYDHLLVIDEIGSLSVRF